MAKARQALASCLSSGATDLGKMLEGDPNLKAIFVANDDMALRVVSALRAAGATGKVIIMSVGRHTRRH